MNNEKCNSEIDATEKHVKRDNLVKIFLKGTEVDDYIVNHMYGRLKIHGDDNQSINENTLLGDYFKLDETFTHQIRLLHQ